MMAKSSPQAVFLSFAIFPRACLLSKSHDEAKRGNSRILQNPPVQGSQLPPLSSPASSPGAGNHVAPSPSASPLGPSKQGSGERSREESGVGSSPAASPYHRIF